MLVPAQPARRAVGIGDEAGEQRRHLGLHERRILELVELVQPQQHRRKPGDAAQLARRERLEQVQAIGGGDAERVHAKRPQRIARAGGQDPIGDPATGGIELDARADPRPAADLAVQVHGNLLAIRKLEVKGNAGGVAGETQPGEALAALDHRAHGHGLQPVEIREPVRGGAIRPAQPERLQQFAHRPVGMGGLRLDPGADDIADQAVDRRCDPRVVPRIPPGPPRRRGRAREDGRVQPVNRPRPLPTPPATRSVEAASAREAEKTMDEGLMGDRVARNGPSSYWECLGGWRASKAISVRLQGARTKMKSRECQKSLTLPPPSENCYQVVNLTVPLG